MKGLSPTQAIDCLTQIVELAERLLVLEPIIRQRADTTGRDGYPPTSGLDGGHTSGGDPVGNLVALRIDHPHRDVVSYAHTELLAKMHQARRLLEQAEGIGRHALPPTTPALDDGCVSCARLRTWSPIHRTRRCRFCSDYLRAEGVDPPAALVRAHIEGRRITTAMVIRLRRSGAI